MNITCWYLPNFLFHISFINGQNFNQQNFRMQNVLNSSPYAQYQPYQQYYPQYNQNYYQKPQNSTVDWKFVNDCNPDMIRAIEDIEKMNQILSLISKCDFQSDSQINQNPNILKLILLAQIVINYLLKCQEELKDTNNKLQRNYSSIENDIKKKNKSTDYYKSKLGKAIVVLKKSKTRERCPTCHKTFQSSQELDQHMRTIHNELWSEWVSIRKGKKLPVTSQKESKLQKQVNKLQKQVEELTAKQRSQYYHDSYNDNKPIRPEPSLFNSNKDARYANISNDELQPPKQPEPQQPPQQQQPIITQTFLKPDETENLAKLNAKRHAEDFLSHRRSATPMHPKQVDEIVQKISSMLHEQSKQVNYGEAVKEENPEELRQDISDDVKSDHPIPETSTHNNLKDIKKPLKSPKRKQKKKTQQEDEKEEPKEKPKPQQNDEHCYGDSIPLSSSSLRNNNFIFSSEIAQYDSTAVPSSAPKPKNQDESSGEESQSKPKQQQKQQQKQDNIQNSDVQQNDSEISFHSESGHSQFVMPSNDYDFATYEEFISGEESDHRSRSHHHNDDQQQPGSEEEEVYYYDPDDEEAVAAPVKPKVEPDVDVKPDEEVEYSYTYEEEVPDKKGFIHPSPQPSNKSLKKTTYDDDDDDEELSF